ncbi:hypothetical protein A2U01_0038489, partial [Trifolium medium]|nr:hypothetical protein [Trifolium medium]
MRKCSSNWLLHYSWLSDHHTQGGPRRLWLRRDCHQQASTSGTDLTALGVGPALGVLWQVANFLVVLVAVKGRSFFVSRVSLTTTCGLSSD